MGARTVGLTALTATLALAAGAVAARAPHEDAAARRQRWELERQALDASLDRLEERLLVDQARVRFWKEMRARHEGVTAVACSGLGQHAADIARYEEQQAEKSEALARGRRVALAPAPAGAPHRR